MRKVLSNIKGSYPWNVLTVEESDILLQNVLTLNKMIMMRENLQSSKMVKWWNKKKSYKKKKIVYTMEESEDSDGSEVEETKVLFMGLDTQASNSDSNMEGGVDLRDEIVSTLEELEKCRKNNRQSNLVIS